jgi:hypothetical protein
VIVSLVDLMITLIEIKEKKIIIIILKSKGRLIHNLSPKQPFFNEPMISIPIPYPLQHTNAQMLFSHTSNLPYDLFAQTLRILM